jgi:hypothetical protein
LLGRFWPFWVKFGHFLPFFGQIGQTIFLVGGGSFDFAENLPETQVNNSDYREIFFWAIFAVLGHFWAKLDQQIFLVMVLRFG